jgi:protein-disulfide isomerase
VQLAEPVPPASSGETNGDATRLQAQLQTAQARIQELQATLDDPQKYQAYQEQRAAENFERQPKVELDLGGVPVKGPAGAPIQVVEFSDFLCPFCRNLAGAFGGFMPQSQGRVAVFFKHYPLDQACNPVMTRTVHDGACELALGGVCAEEQGKFWQYHDRIFSQPPTNPSNDDVVRFATEAGLDAEAMRQCLTSPAARAKLDRDLAEGKRLQVNATPTVFVNGKRLEQIGGFLKAIESESKRLGLPALAPGPNH